MEQELKEYIYSLAQKIQPLIISDDCGIMAPRVPRIYSFAAAIGAREQVSGHPEAFIKKAQQKREHVFGYLSYDYKNQLEKLHTRHPVRIGFEDCFFIIPELLVVQNANQWFLNHEPYTPAEILQYLKKQFGEIYIPHKKNTVYIQSRTDRDAYLRTFADIRNHLIDGDIYEMNYCIEFFSEQAEVHPVLLSQKLRTINPAPFSAFIRHEDNYLICASPERFLHKRDLTITAQPIKGTSPRYTDPERDKTSAEVLRNSLKEQTENVMIVDLMRNDLARNTLPGSVYVDELFGIYGFQRVYQMISTICATLLENADIYRLMADAFPMGSMTGCPKIKAMELIDQYEDARRGLYSGTVGFITPEGDFDFNVVIRSLQYSAANHYLSWHAGSAVTIMSEPEAEYNECLLKAEAMRDVVLN